VLPKVSEGEYEEQVDRVTNILQQTVGVPDQQSDTLLDALADFFEEVANVTTSTSQSIPAQVRICYRRLATHDLT
jgi:hypothetical protein